MRKKLQEMGARNVLISRGGDGAMLITETGEGYTSNVQGHLWTPVGAGGYAFRLYARNLSKPKITQQAESKETLQEARQPSLWVPKNHLSEELLPQVISYKTARVHEEVNSFCSAHSMMIWIFGDVIGEVWLNVTLSKKTKLK